MKGLRIVEKVSEVSTVSKRCAFTLAEVLITLGIIGVVAAVTMPILLNNTQERVRKEQVRTIKYKLTLATDKMKSMGLLLDSYGTLDEGNSTEVFVNELKKHFKIAKVCDNNHLTDCWPTDKINMTGTQSPKEVKDLKTGADIVALGLETKNTRTVGIITADGTPMILTYSPKCTPLDAEKTYNWSTVDNKPETNATTNCISAIFDINGKAKPNKIGSDVRTLNSLFGYSNIGKGTDFGKLENDECVKIKDKLGIKYCRTDGGDDYWGGAAKKCHELGLHLPSPQTLANIAASRYGMSNLTLDSYVTISNCNLQSEIYNVICINSDSILNDSNSSLPSEILNFEGSIWSNYENSPTQARPRYLSSDKTYWLNNGKQGTSRTGLCVAD